MKIITSLKEHVGEYCVVFSKSELTSEGPDPEKLGQLIYQNKDTALAVARALLFAASEINYVGVFLLSYDLEIDKDGNSNESDEVETEWIWEGYTEDVDEDVDDIDISGMVEPQKYS